jgi:tetratricopeptide (TPR) repeat protein
VSYADLTEGQQRLFRRLGLHPGTDIDGYAAAALADTDLAAARRGLEALYDQHLLTEPAQGRYRMHDLVREHALAPAGRLDPDRDRDGATARLLDYYQHTAARTDGLITRHARPAPAPADGAVPATARALEQALGIYRDLGDRGGEAEALNETGTLHRVSGDLAQAEGCHQQALELARDIASTWDEAHALAGLGRCALAAGHADQAAGMLRQALEIFQRTGAAEAPDLLAELDALTRAAPAP